ncbi:hypothetical protein PIB30_004096 [Stylosanthes scabra]|uniref:Uncharacterized protein n=1 Tax=Stylosanthes scabra TaxID=79078 RepID=A0ABU6Z270_9FABA|nr:hypothetical protein [Stylosanthes scabra]
MDQKENQAQLLHQDSQCLIGPTQEKGGLSSNGVDSDPMESDSCPYPPGFGPCAIMGHVHRAAHDDTDVVESTPLTQLERNVCPPNHELLNPNQMLSGAAGEIDEREEAIAAKRICEKGGILFKPRNDDDLLVRLAGRKVQRKERAIKRSKLGSQNWCQNGINGKSLSTRIMRRIDPDFLRLVETKMEVVDEGDEGGRWLLVVGFVRENNFRSAIGVVYGPHVKEDKVVFWEELRAVKEEIGVPLMLGGDFNEILKQEDMRGCSSLSQNTLC